MFSAKTQVSLWKILIIFEIINYQVVTVLCNDFVALKFLRDILLALILIGTFAKNKLKIDKTFIFMMIVILFIGIATIRTDGLRVAITYARRYISPLLLFIAIRNSEFVNEDTYVNMLKFMLRVFCVFSIWGIFQAHVLGPSFLIKLGYPTRYSNAYNAITLKNSYYFGNLGIQRVVGTLSNSNVCALMLGCVIICSIVNYQKILKSKLNVFCLICCIVAYILTFSRANFLAFMIVTVIFLWKFIPKKKYIFMGVGAAIVVFLIVYLIQNENGITHKLVNWVINSLTFKESSAAGRKGIWLDAFKGVLQNPMGLGFGRAGTGAVANTVYKVYSCENSFLAMALDLSILGLGAYMLFIGSVIIEICSMSKVVKASKKMLGAIFMYMAITYMFSNHIYDREANMLIFFIIAITMQAMKKSDIEKAEASSAVLEEKAN